MTRIFNTQASSGGGSATTPPLSTAGVKAFVIHVTWFNGGLFSGVSDNKGNVYNALTPIDSGAAFFVTLICWLSNPAVGAAHTFTVNVTGSGSTIIVYGYDAAVFGVDNGNNSNNQAVGTTVQAGALTPTVNNCLIVSSLGLSNSAGAEPYAINSGFTLTDQIAYGGGHFGAGLADLIQGAAAAVNPTWTVGASRNLLAQLVVFAPLTTDMDVTKILGSVTDAPIGLSITKSMSAVADRAPNLSVTKSMVAVVLGSSQTFPFILKVTDKFGCTAEKACQITIGLD